MPFIAFELNALNVAADLGRAAGISEDSVIAGMARMWAYCWRTKTDQISSTKVRGFFGADASEVLRDFGFLDAASGCYRVKGADRYLRIRKAQSENGKKAAARGNLMRGRSPKPLQSPSSSSPEPLQNLSSATSNSAPALSSNIEHRALNKEPPPTSSETIEPFVPPSPEVAEQELRGDGDGNFPLTPLGFCGFWNHERRQRGLTTELLNIANIAQFAHEAIVEAGQRELFFAAIAYFDDEHFRAKGWTIAVFMKPGVWRPRAQAPPRKRVLL